MLTLFTNLNKTLNDFGNMFFNNLEADFLKTKRTILRDFMTQLIIVQAQPVRMRQ